MTSFFYNHSMDTSDIIVVWISILLSFTSMLVNIWAYRNGPPGMKLVRLVTAGLALLFVIGYLQLMIFEPDTVDWTDTMRGLALFAWGAVWVAPAVQSVREWRRAKAAVGATVGRLQNLKDEMVEAEAEFEIQRDVK